ncbi:MULTISPECIES: hypothetical protein [Saliphagus]|uniref:DUF1102 domain-containing protein n=2 Tax=Saliphagus infecundisoli TaxID=1849069 RepID=A0ABD5QEP3_9EURY|nr:MULTISPECIES: hypothetical protein [Saliphagus]
MNRRNVLAGIGMTVVAGGGALASGAFSQVEADRSVSVTTAGDGSALLQFDVDDSYNGIDDTGDGVVALTFQDINQDAVTTFEGALTVTNNGSDDVSLSASNVPAAITFTDANGTDLANGVDIPSGGNSANFDIEIDLVDNSEPSDQDITFNAQAQSN